jgi:cobalamin 5'-phosphate synthase/cobalamin synthase
MKSFLASIAFCTRIPISADFSADDVGKAARWFPLVGLLLGAAYVSMVFILTPRFPASVVAVLIVTAEALLTGGLHFDGLADMADGFGGGKTREDVLRIMRDHAIGSYGAAALILLVALKVTAIAGLIARHAAVRYLLLAPALGRWSLVLLSRLFPYARPSEAVSRHIGTSELVWATALMVSTGILVAKWQSIVCWAAVTGVSMLFGQICFRRIGGVTGDTLGANEQICESVVLIAALAMK